MATSTSNGQGFHSLILIAAILWSNLEHSSSQNLKSSHTNNDNAAKSRQQPPPFSPSLEHLIHSPLNNQNKQMEARLSSDRHTERLDKHEAEKTFSAHPEGASLHGTHQEKPSTSSFSGIDSLNVDYEDPYRLKKAKCPPELPAGNLKWHRGSRIITAILPYLATESCEPPLKCSISTTVHRRVYIQDGDTLTVILKAASENYDTKETSTTTTTTTTRTSTEMITEPTTLDIRVVGNGMSTGSPPQVDISTVFSDQSSKSDVSTVENVGTGSVASRLTTSQYIDTSTSSTQNSVHAYLLRKINISKTSEENSVHPKVSGENITDKLTTTPSEEFNSTADYLPEDDVHLTYAETAEDGTTDTKLLSPSEHSKSPEKESSNVLSIGSSNVSKTQSSVSSTILSTESSNIPSTNFSKVLSTGSSKVLSTGSSIAASTEFPNIPSTGSSKVLSAAKTLSWEQIASRVKREAIVENGEKSGGGVNSTMVSSLTLWKVSASEWSSCSTREGGQVTQSGPDGRVTLAPRDLQPGTTYFIGRSSWSSSECFKLQITVRSAECGEGSLCSGMGTCHANATMDDYQCHCCPGFSGSHCEERDACSSSPCLNGGVCVDIEEGHDGETYQCLCPFGYKGTVCEVSYNLCESHPCNNGGTCHGNHSLYSCSCPTGWTGPQCSQSTATNPLVFAKQQQQRYYLEMQSKLSHPDQENYSDDSALFFPLSKQSPDMTIESVVSEEVDRPETREEEVGRPETCQSTTCVHGICVDDPDREFRCFCHPGFGGNRCEYEYDECCSNPCYNGGTCLDQIGTFQCQCGKGYYGNRCQVKVDMCSPNPCPSTHTCVDRGNTYTCECLRGLNEDDCEPHTKICDSSPCSNGGTCWSMPENYSFFCACKPGFSGGRCEEITMLESVGTIGTIDPPVLRQERNKSPLRSLPFGDVHSAYIAAAVLSCALLIFGIVVGACHCRVNHTYRKCLMLLPCAQTHQEKVVRKSWHNNLINKAWREKGMLRLDSETDGSALPMTATRTPSGENIFYNMDMCDNQELPLIK